MISGIFEINCLKRCSCNLIDQGIEELLSYDIYYLILCAEGILLLLLTVGRTLVAYENTLQATRHIHNTTTAVQLSWWSDTWARMVCANRE